MKIDLKTALSERRYDIPEKLVFHGRWVSNWFSNMTILPTPIYLGGLAFRSVEHLYKAGSISSPELRASLTSMSPQEAKRIVNQQGSAYWDDRRPNWDLYRLPSMWTGLKQAWVGDRLERLRAAPTPIVEFNNWGDRFFGYDIVAEKGLNVLGRMLTLLSDGRGPAIADERDWAAQTSELVDAIESVHLEYKLPAPAQGALF